MKEGNLFVCFCTYEIHRTRMFQITFLVSLESSRGGGVHRLGSITFGLAVQKFLNWMISSLKIKLNRSWKFRRNWNVPLVLLERSWWARFNGIYWVRFGFRMWEILILRRRKRRKKTKKKEKKNYAYQFIPSSTILFLIWNLFIPLNLRKMEGLEMDQPKGLEK